MTAKMFLRKKMTTILTYYIICYTSLFCVSPSLLLNELNIVVQQPPADAQLLDHGVVQLEQVGLLLDLLVAEVVRVEAAEERPEGGAVALDGVAPTWKQKVD